MMYGLETAPTKRAEENKLDVAEMKLQRWMSGTTREHRIRNEHIRERSKCWKHPRKCYRRLKLAPLGFKRLFIPQSFHKVKLNLSSFFFSKPDSNKAKIFRKLVAFAIF